MRKEEEDAGQHTEKLKIQGGTKRQKRRCLPN